MRHFFYYTKDSQGRTVTNCLAVDKGDFARGYAVCCDKDNHSRKEGRGIAKHRADKSLSECCDIMKKSGFLMAEYMPILTDQEEKFIRSRPKHTRKPSPLKLQADAAMRTVETLSGILDRLGEMVDS